MLSRRERRTTRRVGKSDPGDALAIARVVARERELPPVRTEDPSTERPAGIGPGPAAGRGDPGPQRRPRPAARAPAGLRRGCSRPRGRTLPADDPRRAPGPHWGARRPGARRPRPARAAGARGTGARAVDRGPGRGSSAARGARLRSHHRRDPPRPHRGRRPHRVPRPARDARGGGPCAGELGPGAPGAPRPGRRPAARPRVLHDRLHPGTVPPPARAYVERKRAEGKSWAEAIRCLKRQLARVVFHALRAGAPGAAVSGT